MRYVFGILLCKFIKFKFIREFFFFWGIYEICGFYECVIRSCIFYNFKIDIDYMCIVLLYIYLFIDNMVKYKIIVIKLWIF